MKMGIIRRARTENLCPAAKCFDATRAKTGEFENVEKSIECVGVNTREGRPGKNAAQRARNMVARGAEAIAIASCVTLGTPLDFPCPFHRKIVDIIKKRSEKKRRSSSSLARPRENNAKYNSLIYKLETT